MKGYLITFEGIEGSGKTSQLLALAEWLEKKGWDVLKTREPGGTRLGESIRDLLLDVQHHNMSAKAELLLYLASRAQHFHEIIAPALGAGKLVLCDRFSEATLAYQGYGRGLDLGEIKHLLSYVTDGVRPDLIILLDVDVRGGLSRIHSRTTKDRLDQEQIEFYEKVRHGYLQLAKEKTDRMTVVDATRDFQKVQVEIQDCVAAFLEKYAVPKYHRP